ncbi:alpha/beta fold hydrolase [Amycolatopsis rubida]|uniref:Alpha/beta hydrolase family protein n=1 Tax=Amycolatopsis rubida TaxID=112413 RepID=A0A1I5VEJ5_9PSEU|nr:alpha/beta fold hydrolase [Amycolatopsis rubida]SFQ05903.1 Alpha/beta hydrolase family protein [Amycolatopsis rubida]
MSVITGVKVRGLHVRRWGAGGQVAVLVHGMSADSGSWSRLGPELAGRGYEVLAVDLPGHGRSPRWPGYTFEEMADALVAAVPPGPELIVGHSLGGRLVSMAVDRIRPAKVIYEDPAWSAGTEEVARAFEARRNATAEQLRAASPRWPEAARQATLAALERWDPATAGLVRCQHAHWPAVASGTSALVVLADPSPVVPPQAAARLAGDGFVVRTVPGAGHVIHHDDFDGFVSAAGRCW